MTIPYADYDSLPSEEDVLSQKQELIGLINEQKNAKTEILKCRRDFLWEDFIGHCRKSWTDPRNNLVVTFLTESAVDTGGPKREFFTGKT